MLFVEEELNLMSLPNLEGKGVGCGQVQGSRLCPLLEEDNNKVY